jgi:putative ABC transport system permease protein
VLNDLRFSTRILIRNPSLTAVAVATLTLGIGANTALFSAVKSLLLDSPFRDPDRLVFLAERVREGDGAALSYPDLMEYQKENGVFESLAGIRQQSWNLTGASEPERVDGLQVSASLFATLGVRPLIGRVFGAEEDRPGGARVVVIGEAMWRRRFGADPGVLNGTVALDGEPHMVIGVVPAAFQIWRRADLFAPIGHRAAWTDQRDWHCVYGIGRLRTAVSLEEARTAMDVTAARLSAAFPSAHAGRSSSLTALRDRSLKDLRQALWMLSLVSLLVLALACINVSSLLHAHGIERTRELSVRAALGAGRLHLVRPLLTEGLLLGLTGSLASLLVAHWVVQWLSTVTQRFVAEAVPLQLDVTAFLFSWLVGLLVGVVAGLTPAWLSLRGDMAGRLREGVGAPTPFRRARIQDGLVVAQLALAVVTLVGASLMVRSYAKLVAVPLGIDAQGIVLADLTLPSYKYSDSGRLWRFYQAALDQSGRLPGVLSAALVTTAPMSFVPWNLVYAVEGEPSAAPGQGPECDYFAVGGDYFRTLGISVVEGRTFSGRDDSRSILVAVVDRSLAEKHFPGTSAVGRRLSFPAMGGRPLQIVGVVEHVRNWGPDGVSLPAIYLPLLQTASPYVTLAVRARGETSPVPAALRAAIQRVDPDQPLANVRTMAEVVGRTAATRRLSAKLITAFAVIALSLAALGLYGSLNRSFVRRTREIGIRMALGARSLSVLALFVRQGLLLSGLGLALGLAIALPLAPLLSSLLFKTAPHDPVSIVAVPLVVIGVALSASLIPARRAAKVDPVVSLRCE